jgi:hypothetical protein
VEIKWHTPAETIEDRMFKMRPNSTTSVGRVNIRFNPDGYEKGTGKIAFSIGNRLTYSGPIKTLDAATVYVVKIHDALLNVKTMNQLLKIVI